jgi:hypothetical protein
MLLLTSRAVKFSSSRPYMSWRTCSIKSSGDGSISNGGLPVRLGEGVVSARLVDLPKHRGQPIGVRPGDEPPDAFGLLAEELAQGGEVLKELPHVLSTALSTLLVAGTAA